MQMPIVALILASIVILKGACDERSPCERAEDALNAAADECGLDENHYDLSCHSISCSTVDCSNYYNHVELTARCVDGEVEFDYGESCGDPPTGTAWEKTLQRLIDLWT